MHSKGFRNEHESSHFLLLLCEIPAFMAQKKAAENDEKIHIHF